VRGRAVIARANADDVNLQILYFDVAGFAALSLPRRVRPKEVRGALQTRRL
jgi:hypothetical protein